jgi:integrase
MASFEQNKKTKKWSVRFREVTVNSYKQKRLSGFKTKKEAENAFVQYNLNICNLKDTNYTFDILSSNYFSFLKNRLKESSFYDTDKKFKKHIYPYFKDFKVNDIKQIDILNWQKTIDHYSFEHKTKLRGILSSILKFGEKYFDLTNNMKKVDNFRNLEKPKEMQFWTTEEFNKFISKIDDIQYKAFFSFLYLTGCRKGEALALNWNDIDFKNNTVSFNKSITRKVEGFAWKITTLKNIYSKRTIALPSNLIDLLILFSKSNPLSSEFIFCGDRPFPEQTLTRKFEKFIRLAEIKRIRIHDLRHSHASYLISEGISIVAVAKRLGHSNIEQTLNTYAHLMPREENLLIEKLSSINCA